MLMLQALVLAVPFLANAAPSTARRIAEVLVVAEDLKGRPLADLKAAELVLNQEGVVQAIDSLVYEDGVYRLTYRPISGRLGAVQMSLKRLSARLRGPDRPGVTVRWQINLADFEVPLFDALLAGTEASDLDVRVRSFPFETNEKGTHQALVVVVAPKLADDSVLGVRAGSLGTDPPRGATPCERHLMLRVLDESGGEVFRQSGRRLVPEIALAFWTAHVHLPPGRYTLETIAHSACSGRTGIRREPLVVTRTEVGFHMSEVMPLFDVSEPTPLDDTKDNPFFLEGQILVPTIGDLAYPEGAAGRRFFFTVFPDQAATDPVVATAEVFRDGKSLGKRPLTLPGADARGIIRSTGSLSGAERVPGTYAIRILARQGTATQERELTFQVVE